MPILEPFGGILGLKLAILERLGAHLGSTWRHLEAKGGIWEAYGRHMRGIWEAYGGKREAKGSQIKMLFGRFTVAWRNARGQGAYLSAYKQTYMPAYTAFLLPSANDSTRPASLQAGGAPNLIAPRIPPGQEHLCWKVFVPQSLFV